MKGKAQSDQQRALFWKQVFLLSLERALAKGRAPSPEQATARASEMGRRALLEWDRNMRRTERRHE